VHASVHTGRRTKPMQIAKNLLLLCALGTLSESAPSATGQLYEWCAEDRRCAAAYHVDQTDQAGSQKLFAYLLQLRLPALGQPDASLHNGIAAHYAMDAAEMAAGMPREALRRHWLTLLLASVPSTCDDVVPPDVGVECSGAQQQLRFDAHTGKTRCADVRRAPLPSQPHSASSRVRAQTAQSTDEFAVREHWHTPFLTSVAVWALSIVVGADRCASLLFYTRRLRNERRKR